MSPTRQLYISNRHPETGEVLKAMLEPEGTQVNSVRCWKEMPGQTEHGRDCEKVLVMHASEELSQHPEADNLAELPRVVIGRIKPKQSTAPVSVDKSTECHLDEIFEFPDLINAIESLWKRA